LIGATQRASRVKEDRQEAAWPFDRNVTGREPQRFFEMTLRRVADSNWPAAGAIGPK
jgi:hypothetical protein